MAAPDVGSLTSSAEVFSSGHTLPQIRAVHKSLRVQIDDKAARLRTQVGGSYRELLGTADAIVRMRADMDAIQATLAGMGARCGRAVVGAKVGGLARFAREAAEAEMEEDGVAAAGQRVGLGLGLVARARLLEACALVVGRVLSPAGPGGYSSSSVGEEDKKNKQNRLGNSRGGRLVMAAKVLVLRRLLSKSLGLDRGKDAAINADPAVRASVEASEKTLAGLRRKLLRSIDRVLELAGRDNSNGNDDVLQALCAYSLATSSGARDVLSHFLRVRGEAMALAFEADDEGERPRSGSISSNSSAKDVLRSLQLYTRTLLDVQALVPGRLTEALLGLKKDELLADEALRRCEVLRIDVYKQWCGDDIQYFKPYIRHDDLEGGQAREMLASWAGKGGEVLLQGLERTLGRMGELKAVVDLRTSVLQLWIREGGRARGFDPSVMLDKIRGAVNRRMLQVLDAKVGKLRLVGSEVAAALEAWREGVTDRRRRLWDREGLDADLSEGAAQFVQDVTARLFGRGDAVSKAVASFRSWQHVVDDVGTVVDRLRRQRWDNDVEDVEDEEAIERRQQLLSRDDPQMLHDRLDAALERAFAELDGQLAREWDAHRDSPRSGSVAMYFVRVLRDVRSRLPRLAAVSGFGLGMVPSLHERIATAVADAPVETFATTALTRTRVAGRSLWEGEPELPTLPSPGAFEFLRNLSAAMDDAGMDLWSPTAISVLKRYLGGRLEGLWLEALEGLPGEKRPAEKTATADATTAAADGDASTEDSEGSGAVNGSEQPTSNGKTAPPLLSPERRRALLTQWLFDIYWLRCCLATPPTSNRPADNEAALKELEEAVFRESKLEAAAVRQRLIKASQEYWKKTSLLFGPLT